jgi:sirohydrochlorin cobaltochelatase
MLRGIKLEQNSSEKTGKSALVLFAHGARDPRWAGPFQRLQKITQAGAPSIVVELAFLEFMAPSLPDLVIQLVNQGIDHITVSPIFLGQGGHVLRDLPKMIEEVREQFPSLNVKQIPAVGENDAVLAAISDYCLSHVSS